MIDFSLFFPNIKYVISTYYMEFLKGIGTTMLFSIVAVAGGVLVGVILALGGKSRFKIFRGIVSSYVEIVRGTPILVQLYIWVLVVPILMSKIFDASEFLWISMALIFNSAAYVSEIFRAGIEAVDKGQAEAARSLGMSEKQAMRKIILPQAIKNVLPALANEFIMMIKETSLASVFFAGDIMTKYKTINGLEFLMVEPLVLIALIYFVLTFSLSKAVKIFERRLASYD